MYSTARYLNALRKLGNGVTEIHRRMLAANTAAPNMTLDVLALSRAAGGKTEQLTYGQYGLLGHRLAKAIGHRGTEHVWTRLLGSESRSPTTNRVQWTLHKGLARAVKELGWISYETSGDDAPGALREARKGLAGLDATTRETVVQSRLKQGAFRTMLWRHWSGCAVTGCRVLEALVASHIKPWSKATDAERLDPFNGLLLLGTLDRLFDAGLISFGPDGRLLISANLKGDLRTLGISQGQRLRSFEPRHQKYLNYHRRNVFNAGRDP